MIDIVDLVYNENKTVLDYLESQGEYSFKSDIDNKLKKIILLSAASYFEMVITENIIEFVKSCSNNNQLIVEFVKNKALSRQYHTFFDWKNKSANTFWALFGEDFKKSIITEVNSNPNVKQSIDAFLELGDYRNRLVHQNFAQFYIDKNTDEIYDLYKCASGFISFLEGKLTSTKHA